MTTLDDIMGALQKIENSQDKMERKQEFFMREVETIKRGIYGDEMNGVRGLMETDKEQHKRIKSLETDRSKFYWMGGGLAISWPVVWHFIKEKFGL